VTFRYETLHIPIPLFTLIGRGICGCSYCGCCGQRLLKKYDPAGDGEVSFEDFVRYVTEHEKALRLSFESLDHKRDGKDHRAASKATEYRCPKMSSAWICFYYCM